MPLGRAGSIPAQRTKNRRQAVFYFKEFPGSHRYNSQLYHLQLDKIF